MANLIDAFITWDAPAYVNSDTFYCVRITDYRGDRQPVVVRYTPAYEALVAQGKPFYLEVWVEGMVAGKNVHSKIIARDCLAPY